MKKLMVFLLLMVVFSLGASQSYIQIVSIGGNSDISQTTDLSIYGTFDPSIPTKMVAACSKMTGSVVTCNVKGNLITIIGAFSESNEYFKVKTDYGIVDIVHTLTINKLPNDKFQKALITASRENSAAADAVDLNEKSANVKLLQQLNSMGLEITYTVMMPGEIGYASAGKYEAAVEKTGATFDLKKVYADSAPLVVQSRMPNWGAIGTIGIAAIVLLLGAWFFIRRK
jgi:hypothetical protein